MNACDIFNCFTHIYSKHHTCYYMYITTKLTTHFTVAIPLTVTFNFGKFYICSSYTRSMVWKIWWNFSWERKKESISNLFAVHFCEKHIHWQVGWLTRYRVWSRIRLVHIATLRPFRYIGRCICTRAAGIMRLLCREHRTGPSESRDSGGSSFSPCIDLGNEFLFLFAPPPCRGAVVKDGFLKSIRVVMTKYKYSFLRSDIVTISGNWALISRDDIFRHSQALEIKFVYDTNFRKDIFTK